MRIIKYIVILSSFSLSLNAKVKFSCENLFNENILIKSIEQNQWDEQLYQETFNQIYKYDHMPTSLQFKQLEVKIAFLTSLAKQAGIVNKIKIAKPNRLTFDVPMSPYKAEKFVKTFLSLQNHKLPFLKRWLAIGVSRTKQKEINNYIKQQMLIGEILKILEKNYLLKPNSKFENIKTILKKYSPNIKLASAIVINFFSIKWFSFPLYLPDFDFLKTNPFTFKEFEALKPLSHSARIKYIKDSLSKKVLADSILNFPRDAFYSLVSAYFLVYMFNPVVQIPGYIVESTDSYYYSKVWVPQFYKENGRYPNVFFNQNDQFLWIQSYKAIVEQYSKR